MPPPTPFRRSDMLERLGAEEFDLLVIGGGITGTGVALDAAARGLRTALVERDDFASGTSSKSSKLVHGGLRYLQQGEIRLVYEALRERERLRKNAPHLVKVLPFMIPILTKDGVVSRKIARAMGSAM
ncbi:MAG: glycerol-3-phosphate dehydrogenase, partial [Ilumatobacteraceae bacterium]